MRDRTQPKTSYRRDPHLSNILPSLWELLSDAEREQLLIWSSFYIYKKGEVIYEAGAIPQNAYVLVNGQIKVTQSEERDQIIRLVREVEFFGYYAHFAENPIPSTATAVEESLVCLIPLRSLEEIIQSNPRVGLYFLHDLSKILVETHQMTITLTQKHTRGRLAESLLLLLEKYGTEQDGRTIKAYLSRNELANLSNMTTSNAVRTLRSFQEEGVVHLDGRRIKIIDEHKIRKISKLG
ncbi:MAG: Crp/Fnr family transcriptional regulator [Porphyromonas sp.]|nr:Crp/Fnr family transcriptional regulator [Porphyromonas sp.]